MKILKVDTGQPGQGRHHGMKPYEDIEDPRPGDTCESPDGGKRAYVCVTYENGRQVDFWQPVDDDWEAGQEVWESGSCSNRDKTGEVGSRGETGPGSRIQTKGGNNA